MTVQSSQANRRLLQSEEDTLRSMLDELPEDAIIERVGLEHRLEETLAALNVLSEEHRDERLLPVRFLGAPVKKRFAIDAGFAAEALDKFTGAVKTVVASLLNEDLKARGPLPAGPERSLQIGATFAGSFGFELVVPPPEEAASSSLFPEDDDEEAEDPFVDGVRTTLEVMHEASVGDDRRLSKLVARIHPRAARKVCDFAELLQKSGAQFAAEFDGTRVRLDNERDVAAVVSVLSEGVKEEEADFQGRIIGVLPESRDFEARLDDGRVIKGNVDRNVPDIKALKSEFEEREATLRLRVVTVRTSERFSLLGARFDSSVETQ